MSNESISDPIKKLINRINFNYIEKSEYYIEESGLSKEEVSRLLLEIGDFELVQEKRKKEIGVVLRQEWFTYLNSIPTSKKFK